MRAVTDSGSETRFEQAGAGVLNLLTVFEILAGWERPAIEAHFEGKGYGFLKKEVAETVIATLEPIQARYRMYADDPAELNRVLKHGADSVAPRAAATMNRVKSAMGFVLPA